MTIETSMHWFLKKSGPIFPAGKEIKQLLLLILFKQKSIKFTLHYIFNIFPIIA